MTKKIIKLIIFKEKTVYALRYKFIRRRKHYQCLIGPAPDSEISVGLIKKLQI